MSPALFVLPPASHSSYHEYDEWNNTYSGTAIAILYIQHILLYYCIICISNCIMCISTINIIANNTNTDNKHTNTLIQ